MRALAPDFYDRPVLEVARALIGCTVEHDGAAGVIVETEAYHESEPASHAFVGVTARTRPLFGEPGRAYVYRSYGIHALFNAVCEPVGVGAAVLIRALAPIRGQDAMRARREAAGGRARRRAGIPRPLSEHELCSGPGKLAQALAITLSHNGCSLQHGPVRILEAPAGGGVVGLAPVVEGTRIGITKAVDLRWRFCVAGDPNVSRPRPPAPAPASAASTG